MKNQWIILGSIFVICICLSFVTSKEGAQNKKAAPKPPGKPGAKGVPAKPGPAKAQPAKAQPAKAQPAKAQPAKPGAKGVPANPGPAKAQPAKAQPAKAQPAKAQPAKPGAKGVPANPGPAKAQPNQQQKPPPKTIPKKAISYIEMNNQKGGRAEEPNPPAKPQKPPAKPPQMPPRKGESKPFKNNNSDSITPIKVSYNKNINVGKAVQESTKILIQASRDVNDAINENKKLDMTNYMDVLKKYNDQYNKKGIKAPVLNENYIKILELAQKLDRETSEPTAMQDNQTLVVYNRNLIMGKAAPETTRILMLANKIIDDGINQNTKVDIRNHIDVVKQYNDQFNNNDNINAPLINTNYIKILELHNKYIEKTCNSQENTQSPTGTTYPSIYSTPTPFSDTVSSTPTPFNTMTTLTPFNESTSTSTPVETMFTTQAPFETMSTE